MLQRAAQSGVAACLVCTADLHDSRLAAEMVTSFNLNAAAPRLYVTAGVHPHCARTWRLADRTELRRLAKAPSCVALGEMGLDYARDYSPRSDQRAALRAQLDIALELNLPVFLHQRDAHEDFMAILTPYVKDLNGLVVHCFTAGKRELTAYLELGAYIGITGWFCDERRGGHLHDLVASIPLSKLLLETDSPYLTPRDLPNRRARNESAHLPHIAAALAKVLGLDLALLAEQTYRNTCTFCRLPATVD